MNYDAIKLFFSLIKCELNQENIDIPPLTDDKLKTLFEISTKQSVGGLIAHTLLNNNLISVDSQYYRKFRFELKYATAFVVNLEYEIDRISLTLNEEKIPFILLKGSVLRKYYLNPVLRTSCDIDILVHEYELDKSVESLVNLGYTVRGKKNFHDIHLFSETGIHLELHFNIKEKIEPMDSVLEKVWDYSNPLDGFQYAESNEFFLFHHIAHMAYHFKHGGCGVRNFIDLWVIKQNLTINEELYRSLIKQANLEKFEKYAVDLMNYWFSNGETNSQLLAMQQFVLNGNTYGSLAQTVVISNAESGNKYKYFLNRIFMPYKDLVIVFPKLKGRKYLLPFYEICRWLKVFKRKKHIKKEVYLTINSKEDYSVEMMRNLDLI